MVWGVSTWESFDNMFESIYGDSWKDCEEEDILRSKILEKLLQLKKFKRFKLCEETKIEKMVQNPN